MDLTKNKIALNRTIDFNKFNFIMSSEYKLDKDQFPQFYRFLIARFNSTFDVTIRFKIDFKIECRINL